MRRPGGLRNSKPGLLLELLEIGEFVMVGQEGDFPGMRRPCKPTSLLRAFGSQWASNADWEKGEAAVG